MTDKEKLEKIKALADKMYSHMAYLTSDTRPIRQAMDEYHQFIINEYHKEEPVSKAYTFKSIPRLLDMIQPSDRARFYATKLAEKLESEGYSLDAIIVRESIKIMNGEKVAMATMDKEPVSDDLEEASCNYGDELDNVLSVAVDDDNTIGEYATEAFKAGAKWQETKDESTTEDLGDYITELSKQFPEVSFAKLSRIAVRVAKWQMAQMMAKAVDVEVKVDAGGYPYIDKTIELYDYDKDVPLAKAGDKYKVVLIKEE